MNFSFIRTGAWKFETNLAIAVIRLDEIKLIPRDGRHRGMRQLRQDHCKSNKEKDPQGKSIV
jgi:hypothetical protein